MESITGHITVTIKAKSETTFSWWTQMSGSMKTAAFPFQPWTAFCSIQFNCLRSTKSSFTKSSSCHQERNIKSNRTLSPLFVPIYSTMWEADALLASWLSFSTWSCCEECLCLIFAKKHWHRCSASNDFYEVERLIVFLLVQNILHLLLVNWLLVTPAYDGSFFLL